MARLAPCADDRHRARIRAGEKISGDGPGRSRTKLGEIAVVEKQPDETAVDCTQDEHQAAVAHGAAVAGSRSAATLTVQTAISVEVARLDVREPFGAREVERADVRERRLPAVEGTKGVGHGETRRVGVDELTNLRLVQDHHVVSAPARSVRSISMASICCDGAVKIARVETIPVSVPYRHREVSSIVARDGVSDVLVKLTTDDGLVGWGEACCGADTASVEAALRAMAPFVIGRDPWNREAMRRDAFTHGLWQFRSGTGNFAWAGIDMALWDICGRVCGQPLWRLLGGLQEKEATYFYYLSRGSREALETQVQDGLAAGFEVFYLKVGLDDADDLEAVTAVRQALGPRPRLRLDANGAWSVPQALRNLRAFAEHDIDFVEQPVREHPLGQLGEIRARAATAVCANEGLWSEAEAYARIRAREADVYCLSPTGSARSRPSIDSRGSRTTRACRSASTPTASSALPLPPVIMSC